MAGQSNVQAQTGNRIIVYLDGKAVGMVQSLRASDDYGLQETSQIGDIHVKEWVPSLARHTLTAALVQLKKESLEKYGVASINGDDIMNGLVFNIVIQDKDTNLPLRTYSGCMFASGDIEVTKHSVVARNVTWMATDVSGTFQSST